MCGTVAWPQGKTCGDDEQFDLAAWLPSLNYSWSRDGQLLYFSIFGQRKLCRVFNPCCCNEIHLGH